LQSWYCGIADSEAHADMGRMSNALEFVKRVPRSGGRSKTDLMVQALPGPVSWRMKVIPFILFTKI
jgi:hypothetical protein